MAGGAGSIDDVPKPSFSTDGLGGVHPEIAAPRASTFSDPRTMLPSSTAVERDVECEKYLENGLFFHPQVVVGMALRRVVSGAMLAIPYDPNQRGGRAILKRRRARGRKRLSA